MAIRRTQVRSYHWYIGVMKFHIPGDPRVTLDEVNSKKFFDTKSREQWPYQAINERLTSTSEFGNMSNRPDFGGPRESNYTSNEAANPYTSQLPHYKKLHEYFDKYTEPGQDPKASALRAVGEHWDSSYFYYPGEASQRNRPGFRSVPHELLNKQSWYQDTGFVRKWTEISSTTRDRQFRSPMWPPPGYRKPKLGTKREFLFGVEEPALVAEAERWGWARSWYEANLRFGAKDLIGVLLGGLFAYCAARELPAWIKLRGWLANQYYPGRQLIRSFGEPKDPNVEDWWWQRPLEQWPNQAMVWFGDAYQFKYIKYLKKVEEEERIARELAGEL